MRRALALAERGPAVDPNPRVGCVLVAPGDGGEHGEGGTPGEGGAVGVVVGEGWHEGAGTRHAEAMALDAAGGRARGATAYVTLEPCSHTGRTGPCADRLIAAGVARVVHASADPGVASGGGADRLRGAGVDVEQGLLVDQADELVRDWRVATLLGRPRVTWKYAATLDGRLAATDGTSQWITGPAARADVGRERSRHGAVLTGTGTVLADDPHFTARDGEGTLLTPQPLRVVLGERPLPSHARVTDEAAASLRLTTRDINAALTELHAREVRSVWLECGPTLAAAFWRAGCVDDVVAYVAPALLGAGPSPIADLGITTITGAHRLALRAVHQVGDDVRLDLRVPPAHAPTALPQHLGQRRRGPTDPIKEAP
ncbi:bifunctional diaminohydroxyphosphoribosylaminopyrimidine deaminase/5-amino-6-(5-phosphoribosylamino)uracil reductase RibD [Marihabitans asiaticum]